MERRFVVCRAVRPTLLVCLLCVGVPHSVTAHVTAVRPGLYWTLR